MIIVSTVSLPIGLSAPLPGVLVGELVGTVKQRNKLILIILTIIINNNYQ